MMNPFDSLPPLPALGELHGERSLVRLLRVSDADDVFAAVTGSQAELTRWLPWANNYHTPEDAVTYLHIAETMRDREYACGIWELATGQLAGGIGLHLREVSVPSFEIGYWLRTEMTGKGLMTEAVRQLTTFAFEHVRAGRVFIRCDARNEKSAAVAKRAGFAYEGTLRHDGLTTFPGPGLRDTMYFSRLPEDGPFR